MQRHSERGEGKVGLLIALFVVAVATFVGIKVIPVRIDAYEFRDVLREEARYGAVRNNDKAVAERIMNKARELEIPLQAKHLIVRRTHNEMVITAKYEQVVDLKVKTWVFKFDAKEKAPLF